MASSRPKERSRLGAVAASSADERVPAVPRHEGQVKVVRTEALRAGFKECWQKKDYTTIVQMAKRVPEAVIQEDQALLMYFDNALMLIGE